MFNRRHTYNLLFALLAVGFVLLGFGIDDLKHPTIRHHDCKVIGRGRAGQSLKQGAQVLFEESEKPEYDIVLQCNNYGRVVVNDQVPLPLMKNAVSELTIKKYRYLPTRFGLALPVINPADAAAQLQGPLGNTAE